jgi:hypothetical protein
VLGALALALVPALAGCSHHGARDSGSSPPPLSSADRAAGVVRVVYPNRSLPDAPEVAIVGHTRVSLFLDSVSDTGGSVKAALRISVGAGHDPVPVTLMERASTTLDNMTITLVHAYATGDPSTEAADVTVAPD